LEDEHNNNLDASTHSDDTASNYIQANHPEEHPGGILDFNVSKFNSFFTHDQPIESTTAVTQSAPVTATQSAQLQSVTSAPEITIVGIVNSLAPNFQQPSASLSNQASMSLKVKKELVENKVNERQSRPQLIDNTRSRSKSVRNNSKKSTEEKEEAARLKAETKAAKELEKVTEKATKALEKETKKKANQQQQKSNTDLAAHNACTSRSRSMSNNNKNNNNKNKISSDPPKNYDALKLWNDAQLAQILGSAGVPRHLNVESTARQDGLMQMETDSASP
jgi:DNA polymerase III gamma/tau subunit